MLSLEDGWKLAAQVHGKYHKQHISLEDFTPQEKEFLQEMTRAICENHAVRFKFHPGMGDCIDTDVGIGPRGQTSVETLRQVVFWGMSAKQVRTR